MDSDDVSIELLNVPFSGRILIVGCTCKGMWGGWHASFCYESTTLKQEIRYCKCDGERKGTNQTYLSLKAVIIIK